MAAKQKHYVVWKGFNPGIYATWDACSAQVAGYHGAEYKAFDSRETAEEAFRGRYLDYKARPAAGLIPRDLRALGVQLDSFSVDAACSGNPGILEYRCVRTETREEIFAEGPFPDGTNNIGEFLALVDALDYCQRSKHGVKPIYSDSRIAIGWVRIGKCKTKLPPNDKNARLFELIRNAETRLLKNEYNNPILKWDTESWGEIPADYGRK